MRFPIRILAVVLVTLLGQPASANNNYFLPGDAFYYAEPNHAWFENLAATENPILQYQRPRKGPGGRFCGYAGYNKMRLDNLSPEMRANLVNVYRQLRSQYPQRVDVHQRQTLTMQDGGLVPSGEQELSRVEHNLVSMLIYNRDFDLEKFRPLFRYNENWADAAAAFGHPRDHVANDFFLDDATSITDDWRDSALVKPLKFTPSEPSENQGRLTNVVISVNCQDIQILLFPTSFYEDMAFPKETVVHQLVSGNRVEPSKRMTFGGGFSNPEANGAETANAENGQQDSPEELPYFAYRATFEQSEKLKPEKGHWVIAQE